MDEKVADDIYEKLGKLILNGEVDEVTVKEITENDILEKYLPAVIIKKNYDDFDIQTYYETYGADWGGQTLYCSDHIDSIASDLQEELESDLKDIQAVFSNEYVISIRDIETDDDGFYGYITIEKQKIGLITKLILWLLSKTK